MSSAHNESDACEEAHKNLVCIEFYNSQRCGVDIVNQMILEYPCQPNCDTKVLVIFKFI